MKSDSDVKNRVHEINALRDYVRGGCKHNIKTIAFDEDCAKSKNKVHK